MLYLSMLLWWVEHLNPNYLHVSQWHILADCLHVHYMFTVIKRILATTTDATYLKPLFPDTYLSLELCLDLECSTFRPEITAKCLPIWRCLGVKHRRLSGGGARGGQRVQGRIDVGWRGDVDVVSLQAPCSGDEILFKTRARLGRPLHVLFVCVCTHTHTRRQQASLSNNALCLD